MSEELGRIEKPPVEDYRAGRKLLLVPLLFGPREPLADLGERIDKYWDQVEAHVSNLEEKLGNVAKVYHELVPVGGEEGAKVIDELNKGSHRVVGARLERGAELQPIEDGELLAEFMDWSRCLAIGLQSEKAVTRVYEFYSEAQRKRNEHMANRIDETLGNDEIGLLVMTEGHRIQFVSDIQVFYVAPPALDEIKRWARDRAAEAQGQGVDDAGDQPE